MPIELNLTYVGNGFVPTSDQDKTLCEKLKRGQVIVASWTRKRNYEFHKKFFALLDIGFDSWEPGEIKEGLNVEKNFDKFREDVIIQAGFYDAVFDLDGKCVFKAKSMSFAKMKQDEFEELYSNCINVILQKILTNYTKDDLDNQVQQVLGFA